MKPAYAHGMGTLNGRKHRLRATHHKVVVGLYLTFGDRTEQLQQLQSIEPMHANRIGLIDLHRGQSLYPFVGQRHFALHNALAGVIYAHFLRSYGEHKWLIAPHIGERCQHWGIEIYVGSAVLNELTLVPFWQNIYPSVHAGAL